MSLGGKVSRVVLALRGKVVQASHAQNAEPRERNRVRLDHDVDTPPRFGRLKLDLVFLPAAAKQPGNTDNAGNWIV